MCPAPWAERNAWFFSRKFLDHLKPHILLIHEEANSSEHKLVLRFQNGFGAEILQLVLDGKKPSFFKVQALEFSGAKLKDAHLVQSVALPEGGWINDREKIIRLCQHVARLPAHRRRASLH